MDRPAKLPKEPARDGGPEDVAAAQAFMPVFRAISTPRRRRGLRLETIYWDGLKMLADATDRSLGEVVEQAVDEAPETVNLASRLRVSIVRHLSERVRRLEELTHLDVVNAIIQASPSPAFVLTAEKRILFYNPSFLHLVQSRFVSVKSDVMFKGLRLSLDTQLDQIIDGLARPGATTVTSGFVLGVDDKRVRGTLNLVTAPVHQQSMVIAFVARI